MAAFRRRDRPGEGFRIWPTLPAPWGRVGPWQTGYRSRRDAERVEAWIHEEALARPELIDALLAGRFSLRDAWVARQRGGTALEELLAGVTDPWLEDAVAAWRPHAGKRAGHGLDQLLEYAEPRVRLSWLEGRNISRVYEAAVAAGRKPRGVQRSLHLAVRGLLEHHLGEEGRDARMRGVRIPQGNDERVVELAPEELERLLAACAPEFRDLVLLAVLLAVDLGPLLRLAPRWLDLEAGTVRVLDTKAAARPRVVVCPTPVLAILRRRAAGLELEAPLFDLTPHQVRHHWESARDRAAGRPSASQRYRAAKAGRELEDPAGDRARQLLEAQRVVTLPVLRFKDLRHVLPTVLAAQKVDRRTIQAVLGHKAGSSVTDRYITPAGDRKVMDLAAEAMGLSRAHLYAVGE